MFIYTQSDFYNCERVEQNIERMCDQLVVHDNSNRLGIVIKLRDGSNYVIEDHDD